LKTLAQRAVNECIRGPDVRCGVKSGTSVKTDMQMEVGGRKNDVSNRVAIAREQSLK
jgi:hypothetical protein